MRERLLALPHLLRAFIRRKINFYLNNNLAARDNSRAASFRPLPFFYLFSKTRCVFL